MTQEKSIALYKKCEEVRQAALDEGKTEDKAHEAAKREWNNWAYQRIKEKKSLKSAGLWKVTPDSYDHNRLVGDNDKTREYLEKTELDFSTCRFVIKRDEEIYEPDAPDILVCNSTSINFDGFIFPGYVSFHEAKFTEQADFISTVFHSATDFSKSLFLADVTMDHASFRKQADFTDIQINGTAAFFGAGFKDEVSFRSGNFVGPFYLGATTFRGEADFRHAIINNGAQFDLSAFRGVALFNEAQFVGSSSFRSTVFNEETRFLNVLFSQETSFERAKFHGPVDFSSVTFRQAANFKQAWFFENMNFSTTIFHAEACFIGLQGRRSCDFSESRMLSEVPDFNQAGFSDAPRFDNFKVPKTGLIRSIFTSGNKRNISKFHALRRLAMNAGNYEQTQIFFKGEMRARRGSKEKFYHPQWWISLIYDLIADYGQAVIRPFLLWLLLIPLYAQAYLHMANRTVLCDSAMLKAHYLSTHNALLNIAAIRSRELNDAYSCLYTETQIPHLLGALNLSHTVLSAILLVLTLFGLRSRFRIR